MRTHIYVYLFIVIYTGAKEIHVDLKRCMKLWNWMYSMSTVGRRTGGFEKQEAKIKEEAGKESTFWGGRYWCPQGWAKVWFVYDIKYLLYYCLQIISLHWNTLIYALWIVRWNNKKKCIDQIQNEVSDCLRIKTMLSKRFPMRWLISCRIDRRWQLCLIGKPWLQWRDKLAN